MQALNGFLKSHGMQISGGYGPLKGQTFRIAHMGELQMKDVDEVLALSAGFLTHSIVARGAYFAMAVHALRNTQHEVTSCTRF